jgi:hypothetical protein
MILFMPALSCTGPIDDAHAAYDRFFTKFTTNNHEQLGELFASDVLFFGTGSSDVITTHEGVVDYFRNAISGTRGETRAMRFESRALLLSASIVVISGKWQAERTVDGQITTAGPFRVTAVMEKRGHKWLIVQFHNSPMPR